MERKARGGRDGMVLLVSRCNRERREGGVVCNAPNGSSDDSSRVSVTCDGLGRRRGTSLASHCKLGRRRVQEERAKTQAGGRAGSKDVEGWEVQKTSWGVLGVPEHAMLERGTSALAYHSGRVQLQLQVRVWQKERIE